MLLRNARIVGVGDALADVYIRDGVIAAVTHSAEPRAVGDDAAAGDVGAPHTVDLDGRWIMPGLWDNHVHFSQWTLHSQRLDLSAATSARGAAQAVARALGGGSAGVGRHSTLVGVGFRDGLWVDTPNLADLDSASGAHPVVLLSADLHAAWLNTAALDAFGYAGHPTGLLREEAAFAATQRIETVRDAVLDEWARTAASVAARRGTVGIVDYEMAWNLDTWTRRMADGADQLRVEFGTYTAGLDRAIDLRLRTGDRVNELLTMGSYKVITDGSLNTRTAYCYDEYPGLEGGSHSHGQLTVPQDQLVGLMRRAADAGLSPAVHAIGDHANTLVLDAFETVGVGGRLEHAQLLDGRDVPRFAALGIIASVQPEHAMDDRDVADRYWLGRTGRAFALRSLLDAGAELALGSDAPVAPLDPWVAIAAEVGRRRDGREPWHPEQSISVSEAIIASTRTTVAVGQPADLAVVDFDPLSAPVELLRRMPVSSTLLGGRFTHGNPDGDGG